MRLQPPGERRVELGRDDGVHVLPWADSDHLSACLKLRHDYFVRQRGWVQADPAAPGLESDHYEPFCRHLAVVEDGQVAAYLRALPYSPEVGFMLDRDFARTLPAADRLTLHHSGSVELSRLVCAASAISFRTGPHPLELILKRLFEISKAEGYWQFTVVVESGWLAPFKRRFGLPFRPLAAPYDFPDGTRTVAATATLDELEAGVRAHDYRKYHWYLSQAEYPTAS